MGIAYHTACLVLKPTRQIKYDTLFNMNDETVVNLNMPTFQSNQTKEGIYFFGGRT